MAKETRPVVKCLKLDYDPNHTHLKSHPRRMASGHASHPVSPFRLYIYLMLFPEDMIRQRASIAQADRR
jgi:hypothetical protein